MNTSVSSPGQPNKRVGSRRWRSLWVAVCLAIGSPAGAQVTNYAERGTPPEVGLELLQDEPHDLVVFDPSAGGGWVKARLLDLPGRRVPADPAGNLTLEVVGIEDQSFVAAWSDIERVDLWEERLERETRDRMANEDFSGAYPFLAVMIRDFPDRPGLRELRSEFLWNDARKRAKEGELGASLAMLEELRRYAPDYRSGLVLRAIGGITDQMMQSMMDEGQLVQAQRLLVRLEEDYSADQLSTIEAWRERFLEMATQKQTEAIAARDAQEYREARRLARESIALSPDISGGRELVREIDRIYPLVNVGVLQAATDLDPTRIDNWGSRRSGRLLYRILFEMQEAGSEGGVYDFLFGRTELTPDQLRWDLLLEPERLDAPFNRIDASFLADVLAERARPTSELYFSPWAAAIEAIALDGPKQVRCLFRRPNILPNALLQVTVDGGWFGDEPGSPTGDYRRESFEKRVARYVLRDEPERDTQPREIVEMRFESAAEAVAALLQGEVEALDQLLPSDAARLRQSDEIEVKPYPLPTVHMLVPCSDHPYLAEPDFRRALVYGTAREDILNGELLERKEVPGCRVLSGPFPAGMDKNDPLGYAYDQTITPRSYEPRLGKLLVELSRNQMRARAERLKQDVAELTPIRLAFPSNNMSRIVCEAIRSQWQLLDLEVELVELPVGETYPKPGTADLVYISAAIWEPVIDARRALGPQGLAKSDNQLVGLGLRRLEESRNWREARERLLDLHYVAHNELPVIPLWQMVDFYAHRRELQGVGSGVVSLYQNASRWELDQ